MAMGKRRNQERQADLWIATNAIVQSPGHVFYDRLNKLLAKHRFDARVEHLCGRYYRGSLGRPSLPPGVYFRLLMIGYFEGLDSERGIAWRVADSLSLRQFLGYGLDATTPDHSTISRTRRLFWLSTHKAVFAWVVRLMTKEGIQLGGPQGVDATMLEANAAMRAIVRRDSGQGYDEYVRGLARAAGIEDPTPEQLARFDRKRKKRTSNKDWKHPHDRDARVAKMKDGRTRMAHKAEHAVDLDSGAITAVTLQPADLGDTTTVTETVQAAKRTLKGACGQTLGAVVTDKGYHSDEVLESLAEQGIRSYVAEPERGRRSWKGPDGKKRQKRLYANRKRQKSALAGKLHRQRRERTERTFAHVYDTGGMRRTHLRGHGNIMKRLIVHAAAFDLSLVLRKKFGQGKPKGAQDAVCETPGALCPVSGAPAAHSARWFVTFHVHTVAGIIGAARTFDSCRWDGLSSAAWA
jgi:transposase